MILFNTFSDFVLFLYVHMAHADGEYHPSEQEVILQRMPKLFPTEKDAKRKLDQCLTEYRKIKTGEVKTMILNNFQHFDHIRFSQKYKVYTDMFAIVHADGKVHEAEERALKELKDIIDLSAEADHRAKAN